MTDVVLEMPGLARVQRAIDQIAAADLRAALDRIGGIVESQTQDRIDRGKRSPSGEPWEQWDDAYAATRSGRHSLLNSEGNLLRSIEHEVDGADVLLVGSNLVYAATHQFGDEDRGIPERPYIGVSEDDADEIEKAISDWMQREVGSYFRGAA